MKPFWYLYKATSSGIIYPLEFNIKECVVSSLVYEPDIIRELCRIGCGNYNKSGGCPPLAPRLEEICHDNELVWLIYGRFWSFYKHEKVIQSTNCAIHWKFQDAILARILANLGYELRNRFGGLFLGTGYCMGCPGKKCGFKLQEKKCRNPRSRTYSMEACGINVVKTTLNVFNIKTYWYKKGYLDVPYMIKVMAYFPKHCNNHLNPKEEIIKVLNTQKNCLFKIGSDHYEQYLSNINLPILNNK